MTTRKLITLSVWFLFFVFLISCGKSDIRSNEAERDTTTSLTFRITWKGYSGRGEAIQRIVNSYNEEYGSGCTIIMKNGDEDYATIGNLLENDSNTVYVLPYRYAQCFGDQGVLADLTAEFEDAADLFYPEIWELGTLNESTYGIPWLGHSMCLLYNKNLLNEASIDAGCICDLNSLVEALIAVEEKTDAKGIGLVGADSNDVSWMVNQFIYGFGSSLVSDDGTRVTINNELTCTALEFYKDVLGEHAQSTWVDDTGVEVMAHFRNQEVAFEIQGIWGVTDILKNSAPFEVGIIALKDIGLCPEVGPMMLAVPAGMNEEMREYAFQFIHYMISKEAQEEIMLGEYSPEHDEYYPFRTPIRIDMADIPIFQTNPEYMKFIEGFENPSIDVPVPVWQTVKDEYYEAGLHKVMAGQMSIQDFLEMIETEGNKLIGT